MRDPFRLYPKLLSCQSGQELRARLRARHAKLLMVREVCSKHEPPFPVQEL